MTRIPPADLDGDLPVQNNLVRAAFHNPDMFRGFASLSGRVHTASHLSGREREIVVLTVIGHLQAGFELQQHTLAARAQGVADAEIAALVAGDRSAFTGRERALAELALATETGTVDDALWADAGRHLSTVELLDTVVLAGFYGLASRMVNALDLDLEPDA
jgi:alkylhydroperoxidase family enzyme